MFKSVKWSKTPYHYMRHLRNLNKTSTDSFKIAFSEEVRHGLGNSLPIVALESTIITHGMPYPQNIECALQVEEIIRRKGVIPATIAICGGKIKAGLSIAEISELGDIKRSSPIKTSRRDLAYVVSNSLNGGTTVSGTLIIANKAGIPIFATGGLGGVHRQAEHTFDISADLIEMGKTSVAVFSSGIKSILDIPKTLEYLETQGVFVATFGNTKDFPGFYTSRSGSKSPYNVKDAKKAATVIKSNKELALSSGMLFGVPVPEGYSLDEGESSRIIEEALKLAEERGIAGKELTPFLLGRIAEVSGGKSLNTNVALVKNNASVAADVALELSRLNADGRGVGSGPKDGKLPSPVNKGNQEKRPVIIGGCVLDRCFTLHESDLKIDGRIHYGNFTESAGGVARNITDALSKLECPSIFLSAVAADHSGEIVTAELSKKTLQHVQTFPDSVTAQCTVVLDSVGECKFLLGDMEINKRITPDYIRRNEELIKRAPLLVLDANPTVETIEVVLELADKHHIPVFFEPTDLIISEKPFKTPFWKAVKYISPNVNELKHIASILGLKIPNNSKTKIEEIAHIAKLVAEYVDNVIVTLSADGVLIARYADSKESLISTVKHDLQIRHYPASLVEKLVNVSGAGDCLVSGIISSMLRGLNEEECIAVGLEAAVLGLQTFSAVPNEFNINKENVKPAKYRRIL